MTGKKKDNELAVVYARYSSHNQQEQSIEGQLAAAKIYAETKGYTIIREYCDRAKTGTNDNREEFQRMLSDCAKKQFTVIIVWKVDRFGRNREEITFNKYRAKKHGVRVEYVAENVSDGPEGIILESVLEGMAEYYSVQLSQNVRRGLLESAKKHHVICGNTAYGYRVAADKTYEINPDEASQVRMIFDMYANGSTESEIIAHMNALGLRTRRGQPYNRSSLKTMLKNERYIGTYIYKDIIREEDAIPAIIEKSVFYKVQDMLKQNRRMPSHKWSYSDYLLTGKLFCGHCGSAMIGKSGFSHTGDKHCYYVCLKKANEKLCNKKNVRQDVIEPLVMKHIFALLDDDLLEVIADKTWEFYQKQDEEQAEKEAMKKTLSDIDISLQRLVKSVEDGMPYDIVRSRLDELNGQKAAIQKALAEYELSKGVQLTRDHILFFLEKFRNMDITDRNCQKRIIDTFVQAIYLWDDHLTIVLNYTGEDNKIDIKDLDLTNASDGSSAGRDPLLMRPQSNLCIRWFRNFIILDVQIPVV